VDKAQIVPDGGTVPSREPFLFSDLMQQASETATLLNQTVTSLSGEVDTAIKEVTGAAQDASAVRSRRAWAWPT